MMQVCSEMNDVPIAKSTVQCPPFVPAHLIFVEQCSFILDHECFTFLAELTV
jgi:hypothetical protein